MSSRRIHWARIALLGIAFVTFHAAEAQMANETIVVRTPSRQYPPDPLARETPVPARAPAAEAQVANETIVVMTPARQYPPDPLARETPAPVTVKTVTVTNAVRPAPGTAFGQTRLEQIQTVQQLAMQPTSIVPAGLPIPAPPIGAAPPRLLPLTRAFTTADPLLDRLAAMKPAPLPERPSAPEKVVITFGPGGKLSEHQAEYWRYAYAGNPVEIRGGCYSACTLVVSFIAKEKLCFAEGAFLGFHAAVTAESYVRGRANWQPAHSSTMQMYEGYPTEIKAWIDRHGGWKKLKVNEYWTLYDRDLWSMGYPKCK